MSDKSYEQITKEIKESIAQCGNGYFDILCEVLKDMAKETVVSTSSEAHITHAGFVARGIANYLAMHGIYLSDIDKLIKHNG